MGSFGLDHGVEFFVGQNGGSLATFIAAICPGLFLVWFANSRDRLPEEWRALAKAFIAGILTVIPVSLCIPYLRDGLPMDGGVDQAFFRAFVSAALPEETFKLLTTVVLMRSVFRIKKPLTPVMIGLSVALGFATFENLLYVADEGAFTAVVRALTAIPCHASLGAIMGAYLSQDAYGKANPLQRGTFLRHLPSLALTKALLIPVLLHGLYNFPLMATYGGSLSDDGRGALMLTMLTLLLLATWARLVYLRISRLPAIAM